MAESELLSNFKRLPNLKRPIVIESYCRMCGVFVWASSDPYALLRAELTHKCSGWLKVY